MGREGTSTCILHTCCLLLGGVAGLVGQLSCTSSLSCCTALVTSLLIEWKPHQLLIDSQEVDRLRKRKTELEENMARSKHSAPTRQQVSGVRTRS